MPHANVAVRHDQQIVPGFLHQPAKTVDLAVFPEPLHRSHQANLPMRKISLQFLDHRDNLIIRIGHREDHLVFRIVQPAITREVLIRITVHSSNRLQDARRRCKSIISCRKFPHRPEVIHNAEQRKKIEHQRPSREDQHDQTQSRQHGYSFVRASTNVFMSIICRDGSASRLSQGL